MYVWGFVGVCVRLRMKVSMLRFSSHYLASKLQTHCLPVMQESWDQLSALFDSNEKLGPLFPRAAHSFPKRNATGFFF